MKWGEERVQAATAACPRPAVPAARTAASQPTRAPLALQRAGWGLWRARDAAAADADTAACLDVYSVKMFFHRKDGVHGGRLQQEQQRAGEGGSGGQEQAGAGCGGSAGTTRIGVADGSS